MFPTGGVNGWAAVPGAAADAPEYLLPEPAVAVYFDPAPTAGLGTIVPSVVLTMGGTTCEVRRVVGGALEARFTRDTVYGITLLDTIGGDLEWLPFPYRFNWPQQEVFSWLTDVFVGDDGSEQRRAVRDPAVPRRGIRGIVNAFGEDEAVRLLALLFGWNHRVYGVPFWWNAAELTADVLEGASVVELEETAGRDLIPGRPCLLWRSPRYWEIVYLESIEVDGVTLTAPVEAEWARRDTVLLPLRLGRMSAVIPLSRPASRQVSMQVEFLLEAVP